MDTRKAFEQLEAIRPGSDDLADPDFAEVAEFLNSSAECSDEFARRQQWDTRIGSAMRDVAVPSEAKTRLLDLLAAQDGPADAKPAIVEQATSPDSKPLTRVPTTRSRRWMIAAIGTSAAAVAIAAFWLLRAEDGPTLSLAQLWQQIPVDAEEIALLPDGDDDANPHPNAAWRHVLGDAKQVTLVSGDTATLFSFNVRSRHSQSIRGVVAVIHKDSLVDPPDTDSFDRSENGYITRSAQDFATVSWTQGDLVYVCFFAPAGGRHDLEAALFGEAV